MNIKKNFLCECFDFLAYFERKIEGTIEISIHYQKDDCLQIVIHEKKINIVYRKSLTIDELFNSPTDRLPSLTDHIINEANYLIKRKYFKEE